MWARQKKYLTFPNFLRLFGFSVLIFVFIPFSAPQNLSKEVKKETPDIKEQVKRPKLIPGSPKKPPIDAAAVFIMDIPTQTILFFKDQHARRPPASTTKIATALAARKEFSLKDVLTVPKGCTQKEGESIMGLVEGELITVENLLYGMLVASASDAACTFARSRADFIDLMNTEAVSLGLKNTRFANASGLDAPAHYSSAYDLTFLSIEFMKDGFLKKVAATEEINLSSADGKRWYLVKTTNELLFAFPGTVGVKTGYTEGAQGVFVFHYQKGDVHVAGAIMGSADRFGDTKKTLDWILRSFLF